MSSISSYTHLPLHHQSMRSTAKGGGRCVEDEKLVKVKNHTPQVISVALLVVSAVLGSALFGVIGAFIAPIMTLTLLSVVSDGKCFDPEVTTVYCNTPKPTPDENTPSRTWEASSIKPDNEI